MDIPSWFNVGQQKQLNDIPTSAWASKTNRPVLSVILKQDKVLLGQYCRQGIPCADEYAAPRREPIPYRLNKIIDPCAHRHSPSYRVKAGRVKDALLRARATHFSPWEKQLQR